MPDTFVSPAKWRLLAAEMRRLGIAESDLAEKFVLGSGSGGQKINKTSSCVYLVHTPTGIDVKCQAARSREQNRYQARRELCARIAEQRLGEASRRRQASERIRRQKRRRSRRQRERMLVDKHRNSALKRTRGAVDPAAD